jgi:branched-chain amino acid transport system substrate-binding protein
VTRRLAGALLALLCLAACSAGPPQQPAVSSLVVGVSVPLSGPQAADGQAVVDAVRQVLKDEFHGRIEGMPVTVRVFDESSNDRRDPAQAVSNLGRMVADPSLVGVVGPLNSDVAAGEIPVASAAHLALLSPSASNECLTKPLAGCLLPPRDLRQGRPNDFFRVVPTDDLEPAALVDYATRVLHVTHFAVASDGQAYGKALLTAFEAALKSAGFATAATADLDPSNAAAVDAYLGEAKSGGADAVFFGGRGDGGACRLQPGVLAKLGAGVPLLGGSGLQDATCLNDAGPATAGLYSISAGAGSIGDRATIAARALLVAITAAVKADGGNLPARDDVRLAVSRGVNPPFDPNGDTRDRVFTIVKAQGQPPAWTPGDEVRV